MHSLLQIMWTLHANPGLQLRLQAVDKPKFCLIGINISAGIVSFRKPYNVLCDASALGPLVQGKPGLVGVVRRFKVRKELLLKA